MTNISTHTKRLIDLYRDTVQNYLRKQFSPARIEEEYAWAFGMITRSVPTANIPALSALSNSNIKRVLLSISAAGLSFDSQQKHFYLKAETIYDGILIPKVILGYLGMKQMAMRSGLVSGISNDIIYEKDSFTWYGSNKEPAFASSTRNSSENVAGGYVCLHMKNGTVHAYRMSRDELLSIEETDIQKREALYKESSLYSGPWRERCLRIALWRSAYHEFKHLFTKDPLLTEQKTDKNRASAAVFEEEFAAELNNTAEVIS